MRQPGQDFYPHLGETNSKSSQTCNTPRYFQLANYIGEGNGPPLQYFCLENRIDGGAW